MIRTPIRHLPTTISIMALILAGLIVFVVQRLSASETPQPLPIAELPIVPVESTAPHSRQAQAGPVGRKLPWVRWEYVP